MKNLIILTLLMLSIILLMNKILKDLIQRYQQIQIISNNVNINYGNISIRANIISKVSEQFLVNNANHTKLSDGFFAVIPMEQIKMLKTTYGDFIHCDSPGAHAAKNYIINLHLFASDTKSRIKIKKLLNKSKKMPIVEINGLKLKIEEFRINNKEIKPDENLFCNCYLIKDIKILQNSYI